MCYMRRRVEGHKVMSDDKLKCEEKKSKSRMSEYQRGLTKTDLAGGRFFSRTRGGGGAPVFTDEVAAEEVVPVDRAGESLVEGAGQGG